MTSKSKILFSMFEQWNFIHTLTLVVMSAVIPIANSAQPIYRFNATDVALYSSLSHQVVKLLYSLISALFSNAKLFVLVWRFQFLKALFLKTSILETTIFEDFNFHEFSFSRLQFLKTSSFELLSLQFLKTLNFKDFNF